MWQLSVIDIRFIKSMINKFKQIKKSIKTEDIILASLMGFATNIIIAGIILNGEYSPLAAWRAVSHVIWGSIWLGMTIRLAIYEVFGGYK